MISPMLVRAVLLSGVVSASFSQPAAPPAFEVASIRVSQGANLPMRTHGPRENIQFSPDTLTMRNVNLRSCIRWAYGVMDYQVTGPDLIVRERWDVVAKAPGAVTQDQLRAMLQTLLADRFKLSLHRETKEVSAYVLAVAKGGPKFQESKTQGESQLEPDPNRMVVAVQRTPVSQLVEILAGVLRTPVVDETGLKGKYDITINVAKYLAEAGHGRDRPAGDPGFDPLSLIMRGLQEELGLKLESRKTAVEYLIVDRVEKAPTEN